MAIQAQVYLNNLGFSLGDSQDWMENACGLNEFCFNLQQQQQQQQQYAGQHQQLQSLQQCNQNSCFENSTLLLSKANCINYQSMAFSHRIAAQIEKQRQETDRFINLQNERLRLALAEQRKQQLVSILKKYESKIQILLRQKDEEVAKAVKRTMELEEFLRRMEIEKQTWERVAKENEAMVVSLNNTIELVREKSACFSTDGVEDAVSCCDVIETRGGGDQTVGNRGGEENQEEGKKMICKSCHSGDSCFVFLPCRHFCSCKACETFLDSCPACGMVKKGSIEVFV